MPQTKIELRGICKSFPGILANDHIDLDINRGEIHAVLGENGAGKSTLMRILYGIYHADAGEIYINGQHSHIKSPLDAIRLGVGMVHQSFMLIPELTVAENIVLGLKSPEWPMLDLDTAKKKIMDLAQKYRFYIDPDRKVEYLAMGERQRVEILKMLYRGADTLILDEPTSVLTPVEAKNLFINLKIMTEEEKSIIFITHKLGEALAISDRITVFRSGRKIGTVNTKEANTQLLVKMMIGRDWYQPTLRPTKKGKVVLEIRELSALNDLGLVAVDKLSLTVHEAEILGIAGVSGNGQRELAETIMGLRKSTSGKIFIDQRNMAGKSIKELAKMIAYIPEDKDSGSISDFTITENLILKTYPEYSHRHLINYNDVGQHVEKLISEFDVKTSSINALAKTLSGGNLQKLILARELSANVRLVIACQPTKGLDVGAASFIQKKLIEKRDEGFAVLLISEDLDELLSISDRIAVIYQGKLPGIFDAEKTKIDEIGLLMAGETSRSK